MAISQITQILQIILTPIVHKVNFSLHSYNHFLALVFLTITIIKGIDNILFSFDLKFPNEQHCCVPFHAPVDHLNIFFENIDSYHFLIFLFEFLLFLGCMLICQSCVWLFATPWTVTLQVPLSMRFSRQEYWSGLSFPLAGDISDPGIKPTSPVTPALAGRFFITKLPGKLCWVVWVPFIVLILTPFQISCLKIFFPFPYLFLVMLLVCCYCCCCFLQMLSSLM